MQEHLIPPEGEEPYVFKGIDELKAKLSNRPVSEIIQEWFDKHPGATKLPLPLKMALREGDCEDDEHYCICYGQPFCPNDGTAC